MIHIKNINNTVYNITRTDTPVPTPLAPDYGSGGRNFTALTKSVAPYSYRNDETTSRAVECKVWKVLLIVAAT